MCRIAFLVLGSLLLFRCGSPQERKGKVYPPFYNDPSFTPYFSKNDGTTPDSITHVISEFSFLNEDSVTTSDKDIAGKIHVANFIFTSCGSICPTLTRNMKIISDSIGEDKDVMLLSFSVTPWIDRPGVLKKYKEENGITNHNWRFLTGPKKQVYRLARQSYFAEEDIGFTRDSTQFLHTEHILLVDQDMHIRGIYNGTLVVDMYDIIQDIRLLKHTKSSTN